MPAGSGPLSSYGAGAGLVVSVGVFRAPSGPTWPKKTTMEQRTGERTPTDLVDALAATDGMERYRAFEALMALGAEALPAVREGLRHGHWQVRRWCAIYLDHNADAAALEALVPLLRDPKAQVRLWAVHSIACEPCKACENPIDVVPLLSERLLADESIRVRRMAAAMLASLPPDRRAVEPLETVLARESDRKLRFHAERAVERHRRR